MPDAYPPWYDGEHPLAKVCLSACKRDCEEPCAAFKRLEAVWILIEELGDEATAKQIQDVIME